MSNHRSWKLFALSLPIIALIGCGPAEQPAEQAAAPPPAPPAKTASVELAATQGNNVTGTVKFTEDMGAVHVEYHVTGLAAGKHGFHIHETGDCSAPDGASAGGHFNPDGKAHGAPDAAEHHVGDLGNIEAGADGMAMGDIHSSSLAFEGPNSFVGKAVIVHGGEDDVTTQPTGNAGPRLACGVIQ
ncbi:MAG: hypothetical protein A3F68_04385 [Acidobacteria bacterium RIFCSPLOWO2_12_FULL_54_10]|nr:MAG: hypothetical protein A3F68_04385 [Acidobacteria bacterium RIFCSPLOWO2_12_FULL_54_10]